MGQRKRTRIKAAQSLARQPWGPARTRKYRTRFIKRARSKLGLTGQVRQGAGGHLEVARSQSAPLPPGWRQGPNWRGAGDGKEERMLGKATARARKAQKRPRRWERIYNTSIDGGKERGLCRSNSLCASDMLSFPRLWQVPYVDKDQSLLMDSIKASSAVVLACGMLLVPRAEIRGKRSAHMGWRGYGASPGWRGRAC